MEFTVFWAGPGALAAVSPTTKTFFWVFTVLVGRAAPGVGRHMWTIWMNLGDLGELRKCFIRVSQKIGGFWRWAILDNYYIRVGIYPDNPRDPNRYIFKYLYTVFLA